MDMALALHVPPWQIEEDAKTGKLTYQWWVRWRVFNEELPEAPELPK
jgi:hypothetical protein